MGEVLIDFVARGQTQDEWRLVLVEENWSGSTEDNLRRLQDRLFGCVDAILDGQLAQKFPESKGKSIVIQVECFGLPQTDVSEFFKQFSDGALLIPDYAEALKACEFATDISFEMNENEKK